MASSDANAAAAPRRLSLTQRLVGSGREWMSGFYGSVEKDDSNAGHGFGDGIDDFIPGVFAAKERRRNSSISSEASDDLGAPRRGSITERVAGLQVKIFGASIFSAWFFSALFFSALFFFWRLKT